MTQIQEIVDFFDRNIKKVLPTFNLYERDVFGNNDIDYAELKNKYKLIQTDRTTIELGNFTYRIYTTVLEIYSIKGTRYYDDHEELVDTAQSILDNLIDPKEINLANCIRRIEPLDDISLEEVDTDSAFKVALTFDVYVGF